MTFRVQVKTDLLKGLRLKMYTVPLAFCPVTSVFIVVIVFFLWSLYFEVFTHCYL